MAVDLRGRYQDPYPYWNASTDAPAARLRADLEILAELAERGLCDAAKDISMAGTLGTLLMLLESSRVGALIDIQAVPRPAAVDAGAGALSRPADAERGATHPAGTADLDIDHALLRWLTTFPSYGFVLSVRPEHVSGVLAEFHARALAAAVLGEVTATTRLDLRHRGDAATVWDWAAQPFVSARPPTTAAQPSPTLAPAPLPSPASPPAPHRTIQRAHA